MISKKMPFIASILFFLFTGLSCNIPSSHPGLIGREELHAVFNLTINAHAYRVDFTDSWASGIKFESSSLSEFEVQDSSDIVLDYGIGLRRLVYRIPMPLVIGRTYTRADYQYTGTGSSRPVYIVMYYDDDENSWYASAASEGDDGTLITLTVDGESDEYAWGTFYAKCKRLGVDEYLEVDGMFSGKKSWVD